MEFHTNFTYYQQNDFYFYQNYTQNIKIDNNNNNNNNLILLSNYSFKTLISKILIGIILYSLTIWTIIGNIFVWIALCTNRQLKQGGMSNFLIGNLALSDLLLGLTVLPFSATFSTLNNWVFGKFLCDIWLSIDVLCCTASIWGLLVIAIDRYIATNHPIIYRKQKNSVKIAVIYCTISWIVSLAISIPPFVHDLYSSISKDDILEVAGDTQLVDVSTPKTKIISKNLKLIDDNFYECVLYYKPSFVIASSLGSFYIPLILMVMLYARVFLRIRQQSSMFNNNSMAARKGENINKKLQDLKKMSLMSNDDILEQQQQQQHVVMTLIDEVKGKNSFCSGGRSDSICYLSVLMNKIKYSHRNSSEIEVNRSHRHPVSISRTEARITKTLAIIIGCFVLCWTPFFTAYIIRSQLNDANQISPLLMDIFIWLGYFNSSLNPILYAILNNNFRTAFKDILSCECFKKRMIN
jgi:hypothetical protein